MFDDATLLLAWERGYGRSPVEQGLELLSLAVTYSTREELMKLALGDRDRALLQLRKRLFGSRFDSLAACPECEETIELNFSVEDITVLPASAKTAATSVEIEGLYAEFRPPTSEDLLRIATVPASQRGRQLLARCISELRDGKDRVALASLSKKKVQGLSQAIAESDPQADIQLALSCVGCGHDWTTPFDIVGFLWSELNAWCEKLLSEIHVIAKAYGWSEREILSLGRWRRQVYLGMVRQ